LRQQANTKQTTKVTLALFDVFGDKNDLNEVKNVTIEMIDKLKHNLEDEFKKDLNELENNLEDEFKKKSKWIQKCKHGNDWHGEKWSKGIQKCYHGIDWQVGTGHQASGGKT
jgi:hypothetical protein